MSPVAWQMLSRQYPVIPVQGTRCSPTLVGTMQNHTLSLRIHSCEWTDLLWHPWAPSQKTELPMKASCYSRNLKSQSELQLAPVGSTTHAVGLWLRWQSWALLLHLSPKWTKKRSPFSSSSLFSFLLSWPVSWGRPVSSFLYVQHPAKCGPDLICGFQALL